MLLRQCALDDDLLAEVLHLVLLRVNIRVELAIAVKLLAGLDVVWIFSEQLPTAQVVEAVSLEGQLNGTYAANLTQ